MVELTPLNELLHPPGAEAPGWVFDFNYQFFERSIEMPSTHNHTSTEPNERTTAMIGRTHAAEDESSTSEEELEMEAQRILEHSPEGRPAHPELKNKNLIWLTAGAIGSIMIISLVVFLFYGIAPAAVILVLGTGLACVGNPVFWSLPMRAQERDEAKRELEHQS